MTAPTIVIVSSAPTAKSAVPAERPNQSVLGMQFLSVILYTSTPHNSDGNAGLPILSVGRHS